MAQFPLMKGRRTSKDSRYLDNYPVNMIPIPAEAPNATGYLRSFKGIEHLYDCDGPSYGAIYNDLTGSEYRVSGNELLENGLKVGDISNPIIANMAHSKLSTVFVDGGKLKYFRDGEITELKNWEEGENFVSYPDYKFTPKFEGGSYVTIPDWSTIGRTAISFNLYMETLEDDDFFVIGSSRGDSDWSGVYYKGDVKKFYVRINGTNEFIQDAVEGDNFVSATSSGKFEFAIVYIGALKNGSEIKTNTNGQLTNLSLYDTGDATSFRKYELLLNVERDDDSTPDAPTTKVIENSQDSTGATNGTLMGEWYGYYEQAESVKSAATEYKIDGVLDIDRHQGRYVWINSESFGCTALTVGSTGNQETSPEQRPDFTAPLYTPESDPDNNKAIRSYLGNYVAIFGRQTTEFWRLTGDANRIYAAQKNMETQAGIVATGAVCHYEGGFAAIGNDKGDSLGVILIGPNQSTKISTATIDGILATYKESELQDSLVESMSMDNHALLFVHLPNETFVFDNAAKTWFQLKSDIIGDKPYTGRHILYNHELGLTIGDRNQGRIGLLTDDVASQYGEFVEHLLYTPYVKISPNRQTVPLFDLSFDSIYGHNAQAQSVMISATIDGRTYGNEHRFEFNKPLEYTNKPLISNVGSVNDSIGFKLRVVTKDNVITSHSMLRVAVYVIC